MPLLKSNEGSPKNRGKHENVFDLCLRVVAAAASNLMLAGGKVKDYYTSS